MCHLGEFVNDHKDSIMTGRGEWQIGDEIKRNTLPWCRGGFDGLQQAKGRDCARLDTLTCMARAHIPRHILTLMRPNEICC